MGRSVTPGAKDSDMPTLQAIQGMGVEELRALVPQLLAELERRKRALLEVARELEDTKGLLKNTQDEVGRLVQADPLTGMAHRAEFERRLAKEWARLKREGGELSVVLIDIDDLNRFNSLSGQENGDEILRRVAQCLRTNVWRPADFVARFGEDEFAVLLPNTGIDGAEAIADRLHRAVAAMHLALPDRSEVGYVSVSIGVASRRSGRGHVGTLVAEAERALFLAKEEGKNRVVVSDVAET